MFSLWSTLTSHTSILSFRLPSTNIHVQCTIVQCEKWRREFRFIEKQYDESQAATAIVELHSFWPLPPVMAIFSKISDPEIQKSQPVFWNGKNETISLFIRNESTCGCTEQYQTFTIAKLFKKNFLSLFFLQILMERSPILNTLATVNINMNS